MKTHVISIRLYLQQVRMEGAVKQMKICISAHTGQH